MSWSADITPFIKPGEDASITVGIAESGGLSQFSRNGNNAASLLILPALISHEFMSIPLLTNNIKMQPCTSG